MATEQGTTVQVGAIECYLAGAGGTERRPGVVVIHEAFGLNDNIRRIADQFAAEGYRALAQEDLAALEETLDVLSSREAMRQLAESREAIEVGDVLDAEELAALMAKRARRG